MTHYICEVGDMSGTPMMRLDEIDEDGSVRVAFAPLAYIAMTQELLGIDDAADAAGVYIDAMRQPPPPSTGGRSQWADAMDALQAAETARASEEAAATREGRGRDPRSPRLRGALAASRAKEAGMQRSRLRMGIADGSPRRGERHGPVAARLREQDIATALAGGRIAVRQAFAPPPEETPGA